MSYDLHFTEPRITLEQFCDYFAARSRYTLRNEQAWYTNEDTGVYFCFDYFSEPVEDTEATAGNVSFSLNYYRPHFFALEAEPDVREFVNHFGFSIHDPQTRGMADGPYTVEGFIAGWNHGNEFGHSAILGSEDPPTVVHSRPRDELYSIWRWNYVKATTQNALGDAVFVPRIVFVQIDGEVSSAVVWTDPIPMDQVLDRELVERYRKG